MHAHRLRAVALALAAASTTLAAPAIADDGPGIRWPQIIGIIQANNVVGVGTGAVTGGGQPWSTTRGSATLDPATGRIKFSVKGLVLAGGSSIGTAGAVTSVKGTIVCDANGSTTGGNTVLVDTQATPLSIDGDAELDDTVSLPAACAEPDMAFLIRIPGNQRWIAYGAPLKR